MLLETSIASLRSVSLAPLIPTYCGDGALEIAKELGPSDYQAGWHYCDRATTGWPLWSAMGAKEVGGTSIGLSPAATEKEHVEDWGFLSTT